METVVAHEQSGPQGIIRVKRYVAGTLDRARPHADAYMRLKNLGRGEGLVQRAIRKRAAEALERAEAILAQGFIDTAVENPNLIMTGTLTGRDLLVQYLLGTTVYAGGLGYGAIGTSSTAPASSDTQLGAETVRVTPSLATDVGNNQAQVRFFFPDNVLANGTYREAGTFMNATATANSGKIFNHSLFGTPYVKTTGIDTTFEVDITLT